MGNNLVLFVGPKARFSAPTTNIFSSDFDDSQDLGGYGLGARASVLPYGYATATKLDKILA